MVSFDELWRHIRLRFVFGFRLWLISVGLGLRCISLGFRLRLVSFGIGLRCIGLGLRLRSIGFGFRLRLGFGFITPNLLLRLLLVLNCCTVAAGSLFVEFVGSLGDLWRQIGGCLGFGLGLCFGIRLRLGLGIGLWRGLDGIKNPISE